MSYIYHKPDTIKSPRDCISKVKVVFDGADGKQPYSLAIITWQGTSTIGIRWNVSQREWDDPAKITGSKVCLGEPNSRGYPTWFILPLDLLKTLISGDGVIPSAVLKAIEEVEADLQSQNRED